MTETSGVDALITETADRLFTQICDHEAVQNAEAVGAAPEIWAAFAETGFPWISIAEDQADDQTTEPEPSHKRSAQVPQQVLLAEWSLDVPIDKSIITYT